MLLQFIKIKPHIRGIVNTTNKWRGRIYKQLAGDDYILKKCYERLKELREDNDLKQSFIAKKISCATYTYQRYEYGELLIPIDKLIILTQFYNTSSDFILGLTNVKEPYPKSR